MIEYPPEKSALDGTAVTQAVCPKGHGKERTVPADALAAKGAPDTIALRCWEKLSDAEAKKQPQAPQLGPMSKPSKEFSPGASNMPVHDTDKCQEYLVPVDAYDTGGLQTRKGGKKLDKPAETAESKRRARGLVDEDGEPRSPVGGAYADTAGTGGEKLAKASGLETSKSTAKKASRSSTSTKKSARSSRKKAA